MKYQDVLIIIGIMFSGLMLFSVIAFIAGMNFKKERKREASFLVPQNAITQIALVKTYNIKK
jgi:hypothetical protein